MPGIWLNEFTDAVTGRHAQPLRAFLLGLPRPVRRALLVVADLVFMLRAVVFAIYLTNPAALDDGPPWSVLLALGLLMVPLFWVLGLYQFVVSFLRSEFLNSMTTGVTLLAALIAVYGASHLGSDMTPAAAVVFWAFGILYMGGSRVAARDFLLAGRRKPRERAIIYGAGESGARLAGLLVSGGECRPVAFVDDNKALHGHVVAGFCVYPPEALMKLVETHGASPPAAGHAFGLALAARDHHPGTRHLAAAHPDRAGHERPGQRQGELRRPA